MSEQGAKILIVDDEAVLRQVLRARLTSRGYSVHEASTGAEVLETVPALHPDVIVLDIGLPDIDGIELTRRLRLLVRTPVIMLSVHSARSDKIPALDAGADDFLTKPCDLGELLDRIRNALLRATLQDSTVVSVGDLVIDLRRQLVQVANSPVQLTAMEFEVLKVLALNAGRLLTLRRLAREVGTKRNDEDSLQILRNTIGTLRQKLDANMAYPGHIAPEPGVGYRLRFVASN